MESVLFYGVPHGCSFGSIVAFEWANVPYKLCRIEMLDKRDDFYKRINPVGETPSLLLPNNVVINESFAILSHIAALNLNKQLGFPQGTKEFDQLNYILSFLTSSFHPIWGSIFQPAKYTNETLGYDGIRNMAISKARKGYDRIESMLTGREWLAGNGPTIADAYLAGVARWGEDLRIFELKKEFPVLYAHLQKLEQDKAVQFAHAIEDNQEVQSSGQFRGHVNFHELKTRFSQV